MQTTPVLSEADFVVLTALATAAEAVVLTHGTMQKTQRIVAELMAVIDAERRRLDEAAARAELRQRKRDALATL